MQVAEVEPLAQVAVAPAVAGMQAAEVAAYRLKIWVVAVAQVMAVAAAAAAAAAALVVATALVFRQPLAMRVMADSR